MSTTTEQRQQKVHNAHEHLRHDSTSDSPEVVRERLRQSELSDQRHQTGEAVPTELQENGEG